MLSYFIRRLLLIPPTLFLITLLVFGISRMMPGGPIERMLQQATMVDSDAGGSNSSNGNTLGESELEDIEELYGLNHSPLKAYFQWLGAWPKETSLTKKEISQDADERIGAQATATDQSLEMVLKGEGSLVRVVYTEDSILSATYADGTSISTKGWAYRLESEADRQARYRKRNRISADGEAPNYKPRVVLYRTELSGVLQGNLGRSILYGDPVIEMIGERVPVAFYFGLLSALITYSVSLPLGVVKAIKHRTWIDSFSSILIFIGYSIPGFALGALLLIWLGARLELFPLFGMTSPEFGSLSTFGKVKDIAMHTILPLICYVIGGFAYLTMMMKNSLMDNLAADYVKTAVSRGASYSTAVFGHAFRNSLIPIATTLGQLITIFVGGSMLVERIFDIQGFGLLQFQSVIGRDYPVVMGTLTISSLLVLLGNVLSDLIVATIDPRIKFN